MIDFLRGLNLWTPLYMHVINSIQVNKHIWSSALPALFI